MGALAFKKTTGRDGRGVLSLVKTLDDQFCALHPVQHLSAKPAVLGLVKGTLRDL